MEQSPQNTVDFIKRCIKYFGYKSNIIQTDNGMEFCFFKDVKNTSIRTIMLRIKYRT